jgi:hypothetical protein
MGVMHADRAALIDGLSDRSNPNDAVPPPADVAASSPEAGDITPAAVSTGEAVSARGLAYARPSARG